MRTHYCGEVTEKLVNKKVTLMGWVHRRRDLGGVIFINLRDIEGNVQVVCHPEDKAVFKVAEQIRGEFVLRIDGKVHMRPKGMENPDMKTGQIEVQATDIEILNTSEALPFEIECQHAVGEETRLKYRYIDLRRPEMTQYIKFRAQVAHV